MAKRIFELARELGVTSKVVLTKCRDEGLDIKNHMSTVSAGLEATVREWFSDAASGETAVEVGKHIDLEKARDEAKKARRRRKKKSDEQAAEAVAVEAPAESEAPAEAPAAEPSVAVAEATDAAIEAPEAPAPEVEAIEPPSDQPEGEAPGEESLEPPLEPPAEAPVETPEPPQEEQPEPEPVIRPAGPQVIPQPATLRGPRVVRVEKPDYLPAPRPRARPRPPAARDADRPAAGAAGTGRGRRVEAPPTGGGGPDKDKDKDKTKGKKKARRRTPRQRGGHAAESGEKLKEWRDRDLLERSERLAAATGGGLRRRRASVGRKGQAVAPGVKTGKVEIAEPITVKSLSAATGLKSAEIIKRLMETGVLATVNQVIGHEQAEAIALEYDIELVVARALSAEDVLLEKLQARQKGELSPRAPVVTFLGHVDHGKTSLLDRIRHTEVAEGEAGGITQHIGAHRYDKGDSHVVFLDTPGHEAFTAMRARGANMTDVVVLVVAADDGVMPQTVEAISHARAAGVPIVVALNKIDMAGANIQRALGQLAENDLQPREWGGSVEVIHTSATTGEGVDDLVELLSLEAELLELTSETHAPAGGYVVEAEMDTGRGVVASLLVRNGTLKVGDILLAGRGYGRVRRMVNSHGQTVKQAGPSTPVEVTGLDEVPVAGDRFFVVGDIDDARTVAEDHRRRERTSQLAAAPQRTLESLFDRIQAGEMHELALIIKADVQGSIGAITGQLNKLSTDEVRVNILHAAVGGISTGDVSLAEASNAIIVGFNVVPDAAARSLAESKSVSIRQYRVIYDLTEDVRKALEEGLAPDIREETLGHAEVRQVFKASRIGTVAGCYVTDGLVNRNAMVRLVRNSVVIEDERTLDSLKRFKDDVREVRSGMECGLKLAGYDDIKEGDALEFYRRVEVARTL